MIDARPRFEAPRWMLPLGALLLIGYLAVDGARGVSSRLGVDFYHVWGVQAAHDALGGNPYRSTAPYKQKLHDISARSDSEALRRADKSSYFAPTGTPFFYATLASLPRSYDPANLLFGALQYIAAGWAVIVLARLRGVGLVPAICIAALVELTFNPFLQDVKWGNVNSLQLLVVAGFIYVSERKLYLRSPAVDWLYLGVLAVFLAFKPSTLWVVAALAIHFLALRGTRRFLAGAALAIPLVVLAFGWGAWYFQDAAVWLDWVRYTQGMNGGTLVFAMVDGNSSLPMLLASFAPSRDVYQYSLIIAALLLVMLALAMSSLGKKTHLIRATALELLRDPWFAASAGVVFTFATSPLVWPHYLVLALVPIAWLFRNGGGTSLATAGAVLAYAALSTPLISLLLAGQQYVALRALLLFCWIPLVPGLLSQVAERHRRIAASVRGGVPCSS